VLLNKPQNIFAHLTQLPAKRVEIIQGSANPRDIRLAIANLVFQNQENELRKTGTAKNVRRATTDNLRDAHTSPARITIHFAVTIAGELGTLFESAGSASTTKVSAW
jgi:hypothetical protein